MAEAANRAPQGSVLDHIVFVIYVNDQGNNLMMDHLPYADDVKSPPPKTSRGHPKLLGR